MHDTPQAVSGREFRRDFGDLIIRAASGEVIVVERHGFPIAILRKARREERPPRISMLEFRRHIGRTLRTATERPVLVTWYSDGFVVLAPVPTELLPPVLDTQETA